MIGCDTQYSLIPYYCFDEGARSSETLTCGSFQQTNVFFLFAKSNNRYKIKSLPVSGDSIKFLILSKLIFSS